MGYFSLSEDSFFQAGILFVLLFLKFLFVLPGGHQGAHFRRSQKTNEEELVMEEHSVEAAAEGTGQDISCRRVFALPQHRSLTWQM